jgi:hypothetical protein
VGTLAAVPLARGSDPIIEVGSRVTIAALLALVAALVLGWPSLVTVALVLVGGLYGAQLAVDDAPLDAGVALFAAGVVLTAELAYWSLEEREGVRVEPGEGARRLVFLALLTLATLALAGGLLALVDGVSARGLAVDVVGAAAAAAVLLAVVLAARDRARAAR